MVDVDTIALAADAVYGVTNVVAAFNSNVNAIAHNGLHHGFCSDQSVALTINCLATS